MTAEDKLKKMLMDDVEGDFYLTPEGEKKILAWHNEEVERKREVIKTFYSGLMEGKQLVIVEFDDKRCLTFLVEDIERPQVPGSPAFAIQYFKDYKTAKKAIIDLYHIAGYTPKHKGYLSIYKSKKAGAK